MWERDSGNPRSQNMLERTSNNNINHVLYQLKKLKVQNMSILKGPVIYFFEEFKGNFKPDSFVKVEISEN